MPYGNGYTYDPPAADATPYAYIFYPVYGWTWVASPWILGWGQIPYFGPPGPWRYSWYRPAYRAATTVVTSHPGAVGHRIAPVSKPAHPVAPVSRARTLQAVITPALSRRPPFGNGR
jgi:hypothetical protein